MRAVSWGKVRIQIYVLQDHKAQRGRQDTGNDYLLVELIVQCVGKGPW